MVDITNIIVSHKDDTDANVIKVVVETKVVLFVEAVADIK